LAGKWAGLPSSGAKQQHLVFLWAHVKDPRLMQRLVQTHRKPALLALLKPHYEEAVKNEAKEKKVSKKEAKEKKVTKKEAKEKKVVKKEAKGGTGRWTAQEHDQFLQALELHGKNGSGQFLQINDKMAAMVPTRTIVQIRSHAQKHFAKTG
jgi:SHAQKYF class myb-like DNA-binding protein